MAEFWNAVGKAKIEIGSWGSAEGIGVFCITFIVIVALLITAIQKYRQP